MKFIKSLRNIVYVNVLTIQITFFAFYAIMGITYIGKESDSTYIYALSISSILTYMFICYDILIHKIINRIGMVFISIPLMVIMVYYTGGIFTDLSQKTIMMYVLLVVPSMLVGYVIAYDQNISYLKHGMLLVSIIVALAVLRSLDSLVGADVISLMYIFGGGTYQALSYASAFAFITILCHILFYGSAYSRFTHIALYFALVVLLLGIVLSGGRGGPVVVIFGSVFMIFYRHSKIAAFSKLLYTTIIIVALISYFEDISYYQRLSQTASRLFSYLSDYSIDLTQTSNRDHVYNLAIQNIKKSLLFGYGPFTYVRTFGNYYAHNIFLDILIHGGIIYLSLWIYVLIKYIIKIKKMIQYDIDDIIILIPIFYSFVMLQFSGTYLQEGLFWFSLSYVFTKTNLKKTLNDLSPQN